MIRKALLFGIAALLVSSALSGAAQADDRPVVYASNYPLYFFANEIAGDVVDVRLPEMEGDPAWDVYFAAEDVDAVVAKVKEAGGSVLVEPFDLPVDARMAVVADPFGAVFEIMTYDE